MLLFKRDASLNNSISTHNHDPNEDSSDNLLGNASDYILVAMIVSMLLCMAVCCLCLFCRSSQRFTMCGWDFQINERNASVGLDELSELHEVVPLTPTSASNYNISDIEKKLKSDPPPPQYTEVTNITMFERFRRKNKRRGGSTSDDKSISEFSGNKFPELQTQKSKRSDKKSLSRFFQRSISYQPPRVSMVKTGNIRRKCSDIKEEGPSIAFLHHNKPSKSNLQKSASDYAFGRSISISFEPKFNPYQPGSNSFASTQNCIKQKDNQTSKEIGSSKDLSSSLCDDEVFM